MRIPSQIRPRSSVLRMTPVRWCSARFAPSTMLDAPRPQVSTSSPPKARKREGHTGRVSTLPLVPAVVDAVAPIPVIAAGGIADGRGIAAALMLGAEGVWLGTRFIATTESGVSDAYRARVITSSADDTVLTDVFDLATGMPWPDGVSGRAIVNQFSERWHGREDALRGWVVDHRDEYLALGPDEEIDNRPVWAGEATSFVTRVESAAEVVATLAAETAQVLSNRPGATLRE